MKLPDKVTFKLVDNDPHTYRLNDKRGYTHRSDLIRVTSRGGQVPARYYVEVWRPTGWTMLLSGILTGEPPDTEAIGRTVALMYGEEDHG